MDLEQWSRQGRRLGAVGRAVAWWIGDWLRYGNERWGERYVRAARLTGYDVQTLTNMVYVASSIPPDERRQGLSWSHHAELAALEPGERQKWLDRAESERLSVRCLREEMRRARRADRANQPRHSDSVTCPNCGQELLVDRAKSHAKPDPASA
jgi:hypothetical protein